MTTYSYNPYDVQYGYVLHDSRDFGFSYAPQDAQDISRGESPSGPDTWANALHTELMGQVNYVPYPEKDNRAAFTNCRKDQLQRLFIGQLPYDASPMQVQWIVYQATGKEVFLSEKIQKWTGNRQSKGCVHTYCYHEDTDLIINFLHRRVLVDDTGVWIAADAEQHELLEAYCKKMKEDKTMRFRERPYQPVVAQLATSNFVPRTSSPRPDYQMPPQYDEFVKTSASHNDLE